MAGPYFKGQVSADCGCYYPDVVRLGDDLKRGKRILHCISHGKYEITLPPGETKKARQEELIAPSDEWREEERQRLRSIP